VAVGCSVKNAALNGTSENFVSEHGNFITDSGFREHIRKTAEARGAGNGFNIVVANIVADAIISMHGLVKTFLKENGVFIASGIITERACDVVTALTENGFQILDESEKDGWFAVTAGIKNGENHA
jgi:ribosomal protein L11 methyltransferase